MEMKKEIKTATCGGCGVNVEYEVFQILGLSVGVPLKLCTACDQVRKLQEADERQKREAIAKVRREKEERDRVEVEFKRLVPDRYRKTDLNHPDFNRELWKRVSLFQPSAETPFLGVVGITGLCKTRCLSLLLRTFLEGRRKCDFVNAADFGFWASRQHFDDNSGDYRRRLEKPLRSQVVLFDDLGKLGCTEAPSKALYRLVEAFHNQNRTILWTSNRPLEELAPNFSEEYGEPLFGRLTEGSQIIRLD